MSFNPEKAKRFLGGVYVGAKDYDKLLKLYRDQTVLLHEVSAEADPAGTLRENIALKETVKALEIENEELKAEITALKGAK